MMGERVQHEELMTGMMMHSECAFVHSFECDDYCTQNSEEEKHSKL
jgi:hypothetical protein